VINNSVYEPQHVHTNGPTWHPPPVSLLSMTSNMGDSSFMASTATVTGDEYACECWAATHSYALPSVSYETLPDMPEQQCTQEGASGRRGGC
jgi:hypothetical protein